MTAPAVYRRARHAAHYAYAHPVQGHDLESWDVAGVRFADPRPSDVPDNAERHSGYVDANDVTHVVYVRRAPLSPGVCQLCARETHAVPMPGQGARP